MKLSAKEVETISAEYLRLRDLSSQNIENLIIFKNYQNWAVKKLEYLVLQKTFKYKKFSNYEDLVQDGMEGLLMAFKSFNPNKGSFVWWANKYINTRISRAANMHSTIRFPIKKAKEIQPFKVSKIPVMIDEKENVQLFAEKNEIKEKINRIILTLSPLQQHVMSIAYGLNGIQESSEKLKLSTREYRRILKEAHNKIKENLKSTNV